MKKRKFWLSAIPVYAVVLICFLVAALAGNRAITTLSENAPLTDRKLVIIDPGHGGVDGGAISCTGVPESQINLQIAKRLNDLLQLLGVETMMTRAEDRSLHTQGETIAAKKVSDLKERVRIANAAQNAILVSIHQNQFTDGRYSGAQVFYSPNPQSSDLAGMIQRLFIQTVNIGSNRKTKKADGIYLLQKVDLPAVLVECGFLSNPTEEAKLRTDAYQRKVAAVIAAACCEYLHGEG